MKFNKLPTIISMSDMIFESYWASGKIRLIRGLIMEDLEWSDDLKDAIFPEIRSIDKQIKSLNKQLKQKPTPP